MIRLRSKPDFFLIQIQGFSLTQTCSCSSYIVEASEFKLDTPTNRDLVGGDAIYPLIGDLRRLEFLLPLRSARCQTSITY